MENYIPALFLDLENYIPGPPYSLLKETLAMYFIWKINSVEPIWTSL